MSTSFYITFSDRYRNEAHPVADIDPDGYVRVTGVESMEQAHKRAYQVFNAYFAGIVTDKEFNDNDYPLGELYRI